MNAQNNVIDKQATDRQWSRALKAHKVLRAVTLCTCHGKRHECAGCLIYYYGSKVLRIVGFGFGVKYEK